MEQGSPQNSTSSSSLEQSKLSSIMPRFLSPRQLEKRPRVVDAEEEEEHTTSFLALLTGGESLKPQQIGPSFPRPPTFTTLGDLGVNFNTMPSTPTPIRTMAIQGTRNLERSTLKRKNVCEDDTTPNPNILNFSDQGYSSRNYGSVGLGYSVYDEKYRAVGLPVDPHLRMFIQIYGKGNAGFS